MGLGYASILVWRAEDVGRRCNCCIAHMTLSGNAVVLLYAELVSDWDAYGSDVLTRCEHAAVSICHPSVVMWVHGVHAGSCSRMEYSCGEGVVDAGKGDTLVRSICVRYAGFEMIRRIRGDTQDTRCCYTS